MDGRGDCRAKHYGRSSATAVYSVRSLRETPIARRLEFPPDYKYLTVIPDRRRRSETDVFRTTRRVPKMVGRGGMI